MKSVKELQWELLLAGAYGTPPWEHMGEVDGILGPKTRRLLAKRAPSEVRAPWLDYALSLEGTKEGPGKANNPVIMDWADSLDLSYPGDDVSWCGLFVAHCITATSPNIAIPQKPLLARNWLKVGTPVTDESNPQPGDVIIFWRESPNSWKGHVAFVLKPGYIIGGNQSNKVSVMSYNPDKVLGIRRLHV